LLPCTTLFRSEPFEATTGTRHQAPIGSANPTTLPFLLILVGAGIPLPWPGLDVVEPHVLDPGTVGPRLLAGDRTGMAPDALVEVHHNGDLRHDPADRPFPRSGSFLPFRHQ